MCANAYSICVCTFKSVPSVMLMPLATCVCRVTVYDKIHPLFLVSGKCSPSLMVITNLIRLIVRSTSKGPKYTSRHSSNTHLSHRSWLTVLNRYICIAINYIGCAYMICNNNICHILLMAVSVTSDHQVGDIINVPSREKFHVHGAVKTLLHTSKPIQTTGQLYKK